MSYQSLSLLEMTNHITVELPHRFGTQNEKNSLDGYYISHLATGKVLLALPLNAFTAEVDCGTKALAEVDAEAATANKKMVFLNVNTILMFPKNSMKCTKVREGQS